MDVTKESDRNPAPVGGDFPCLWGQAFMGGRERERARARERERERREREREKERLSVCRDRGECPCVHEPEGSPCDQCTRPDTKILHSTTVAPRQRRNFGLLTC